MPKMGNRVFKTLSHAFFIMTWVICFSARAYALDITLAWDPSEGADGYTIYYKTGGSGGGRLELYEGKGAEEGDSPFDIYLNEDEDPDPHAVNFTLHNLEDEACFFVVTAFNSYGESGPSNEAVYDPAPSDLFLDNGDPGTSSTGVWRRSVGPDPFGNPSVYSNDIGSTYSFETSAGGQYEVYLYWTYYSNRCTSVPVEIYDGPVLLDKIYVNQQQDAARWNLMGFYPFTGTAKVVVISEGGCTTCADGVRLVRAGGAELHSIKIEGPLTVNEKTSAVYRCRAYYTDGSNHLVAAGSWQVDSVFAEITDTGVLTAGEVYSDEPSRITAGYSEGGTTRQASMDITITDVTSPSPPAPSEVFLDNGDPGTSSTGVWRTSVGADPFGNPSVYSNNIGSTYSFETPADGQYEVYLCWTYYSNRCTGVPVEIYDGPVLLDTVYVNQQQDAARWNLMGFYSFTGTAKVVVISEGGCTTCADGVRLVPSQHWPST